MAQTLTVNVVVTDANGASRTGSVNVTLQTAPVVTSVTVTPQSAPAGTSRHFVVVATGDTALTYALKQTGKPDVVNSTGIFDVVI